MPRLKETPTLFRLWSVIFNNGEEIYLVVPYTCTFSDMQIALTERGKSPDNVTCIKLVSLACHVFEESNKERKK